ncbi:class I SAM-dependent methyltransferase [Pontivivens insulae]|uniref:Trans-aconitate 2-methyltransferase n=1 Tax=Pontivivens insulae TaxID=1639689 RepID=A0A2R8ABZ4_9RHOB|nr:class I SAM-dependent methyltransferase [Pontivivens insulae]RED11079.1 methyltransferase family protein [Pontivivens insulae]SPF29746.1 Trans-aconitate 2-methyltransferase [Pontivivens insulae]
MTDPIFTLHQGLLREAPGSDATTLRTLGEAGIHGAAQIADMGSGPGAASLVALRALPEARVTAVDHHGPYLETLRQRASAAGLSARLSTRQADMADPGFAQGTLDLILCEGALYFLGVEDGLRTWRPLLAPGGRIAFSEVIWIRKQPDEAARLFWMEYPQMTNRTGVRARVEAAGFRVVSDFVQPKSDWEDYLGPLGTRAEALRPEADETLRAVLEGAAEEVALFRRWGDNYAYAVFVVEPA